MRVALASILLLLAGCAAPGDDPPPDAPGASPTGWAIDDCAFVIAQVRVDEASLLARLPEGFALSGGQLPRLPAGPGATIDLDAYACGEARWGDAVVSPSGYGSYYTAVIAPEALAQDGYDATFVKFDTLVSDPATRATLLAAGLPVHEGEATVAIAGPSVSARLAFADGGGFSLTGTMQPPEPAGEPLPFMEFTPLEGGGLARWHARLHDASIGQGAGVVELPAGSWVRDLVGSERAPATFIAGTWNLDEADVAFPIEWP